MKKTTNFKKLMSAILALVMILSTLMMLPMTVSAATLADSAAWDGTTKTQPEGAGTKDSPYLIASAANLYWVAYESTYMVPTEVGAPNAVCYLTFTANIDLANHVLKPIVGRRLVDADTNAYNYVTFIVDGQGATIKGLNITGADSTGLFAYVGNGSSFSNIKLSGAYVATNSGDAVGALVGEAVGYIDMYNCHIDAASTVKGVKSVGGLFGYMNPGKATRDTAVSLTYCTSAAKVECTTNHATSVTPYVGGIFGRLKTDVDLDIAYCYASGSVELTKTAVANVSLGGIFGQISEANKVAENDFASGDTVTVKHCVNEASLVIKAQDSSNSGTSASYNWMGGIGGHFNMGAPATTGNPAYHHYEVNHCFDYSTKVMTFTSDAGTQNNAVNYVCGNHADWQQTKSYKFSYGVKNAATALAVNFVPRNNYNTPEEMDIGEVASLTTEVIMNMTTTTAGDEISKIKTAISTLGEATVGGAAASDGKERNYAWYTADGGTKEAPYQIANAADWAGLVDLSLGTNSAASGHENAVNFNNKYFELTGDIDLEGYMLYPVGGKATIHLDGKNHTIKNADFSASSPALFTFLGRNSTVKNLVIDNVDIEASGNAAFLAIEAKVGLVCYNIHVKDTCSIVSGGNTAAGLIAILKDTEAHDEDAMINFQFCVNEADIAARATVGGIVADLQGCFAYNFDFCVNKGDLTSTATNQANSVGGVFGQFARKENSVPNFGTITNCYNTGKLSCMADAGQYIMTGGIFGVLRAFDGSEMEMENCFDYSARYEASADTAKHLWGGLAGNADNTQLLKWLFNSFAANDPSSENVYGVVVRWTIGGTTVAENYVLMEAITDEILNYAGEPSTMQAEMEKIDAAIASLTFNDLSYVEGEENLPPVSDPSVTPGTPSNEETEKAEDEKDDAAAENDADETTDAPAEEGCGSSVSATFAVLALTAACGMAIVGKKKED